MQTIKYLIVDDEPQARKLLQAYMAGLSGYQLIKSCANAMEAYEALHTSKIDFMFLDIKMPLLTGVDFLRSLKKPPMVIFTTAYHKYAMEGYELNITDYLLKPVSLTRLLQALEKIQSRLHGFRLSTAQGSNKTIDHIFVKSGGKLLKINLDELLLVEGMQNYVKLHLKDKTIVTAHTMKTMEEILPERQFLRVNRSFIVPVAAIRAIDGNTVETDYKSVPIGVSFKSQVIEFIKNNN